MALAPGDLVSSAQLATSLGCSRRNINISLQRWGIQRYGGGRVSRSEYLAARERLGSETQARNSAKAKQKLGSASFHELNSSRPNGQGGEVHGRAPGNGNGNGNGNDGVGGRQDGKSKAEAERMLAWFAAENKRMDLELRKGELLERKEVVAAFHSIGRIIATARETRPNGWSPLLVAKTDVAQIEAIIRHESRAEDERIAIEISEKFGVFLDEESKADPETK